MKRFFGICVTLLVLQQAGPAFAQARDIGQIADGTHLQMLSLSRLFTVFAFLLGVGLALFGLFKLKANGESPNDPSSRKVTAFILIAAGAALVGLPSLISSGVITLFGDTSGAINPNNPESYLHLR